MITQHTTTTELGVMLAETLANLAVERVHENTDPADPDPHGLAIAAVRAIESTELVINALGKRVDEIPPYAKRLAAAMAAAVWVTGIPEHELRNTEDAPGFDTGTASLDGLARLYAETGDAKYLAQHHTQN